MFVALPIQAPPAVETVEEAPFLVHAQEATRTTSGSSVKEYILEVNGGGLALEDFDGDGDLDLVVVDGSTLERVEAGQPGLPPVLLLGDGAGALLAPERATGLTGGRWGMGAATGDVDSDGDPDLLVTNWGADQLFRNDGDASFELVEEAGLRGKRWGTSAAFLDADADGDLDLAVVNYLAFSTERVQARSTGACRWKGHAVMCGPEGLSPVHDQFYVNDGTGGFVDATQDVGFRPREAGFGLGILTLDADVDGDVDLYVTNDSTPNHLWKNDGAGAFREAGFLAGVALNPDGKEQAGMGCWANDVNLDGLPDLVVTNFSGESNAMYLSRRKRWSDRSAPVGIGGASQTKLGWGTALEDFDHDGFCDLVVFNGHVYPEADRPGTDTSYAQPDFFHRGNVEGRFTTEALFAGAPFVARASTAGDLDGDGDLDLVALAIEGPIRVLENVAAQGPSLTLRLVGRGKNTAAIGARVEVTSGKGEDAWRRVRELGTSAGFQAARPASVHFGLGERSSVDEVRVTWPDGTTSRHGSLAAGAHVLRQPEESR